MHLRVDVELCMKIEDTCCSLFCAIGSYNICMQFFDDIVCGCVKMCNLC